MKLIMCKGLPASGKSTWAKAQEGFKRVNKDDLRAMLDDKKWSKKNEKLIVRVRDDIIEDALAEGFSVICDDTNFAPEHEVKLREIAERFEIDFEVKDFTDVPLEECIERDRKRVNSVGKKVIMGMYNQYLKPEVPKIKYLDGKPDAILCDIDGTLAIMGDRSPYDWKMVREDAICDPIFNILAESNGKEIILLSGRDSVCRKETEEWLELYDVPYHKLLMRAEGDSRKDSIVKEELYRKKVEGKYNVSFVLDDRNQVVEMWRNLGLTCLQVAEGDF